MEEKVEKIKIMELPIEIKRFIENKMNSLSNKELNENSRKISINYRENDRSGKSLLNKENEAIAYAISRMPATFGAVSSAIENVNKIYNLDIKKIADFGAGTGTASIAVNEMENVEKINCFEREDAMIKVGKQIFKEYNDLELKTEWKKFDITKQNIEDKFDLVIASYMINEVKEENFEEVINKMWNSTEKVLIIIEPGTVQGYRNIMKAKEILINNEAKIIAPCMSEKCKLSKEDWCNFSCRVQRSKIHKETKGGEAPYEDEKYMYIAVGKEKVANNKSRVIRHPLIYSGYVKLKLCTREGIKEETVTKKDKEKFRIARKIKNGELI